MTGMSVKELSDHGAADGAKIHRSLPFGAELQPNGGCHFRVWAPAATELVLVHRHDGVERRFPLISEGDGIRTLYLSDAGAGDRYGFILDPSAKQNELIVPDPASRFQPDGPHGLSQIVNPHAFAWRDAEWRGLVPSEQVLYEMHVGTFTEEGTWSAAAAELPRLRSLGITAVELLPVADFPGSFGWGYDGVNFYAPTRLYGSPDDFRSFVDEAHRSGLGVILDVVYNHYGPDGNYLSLFAKEYLTERHKSEWGDSPNFDGPGSAQVRRYFISNVGYWIREFHLDGLRFDATQQMFDDSPRHVLSEMAQEARRAGGSKPLLLVAENEPQASSLVRAPEEGGFGLDTLWNDDFHHSVRVLSSGDNEAYFSGYRGDPQEFISLAKYGYLYQGQYYDWQNKRRGCPALDLRHEHFVCYLENHDQLANTGTGQRLHQRTSPGQYRALTTLLILGPWIPMLFQGQEYGTDAPFLYFADHNAELAPLVEKGRKEFLSQFKRLAGPSMEGCLPAPHARESFERCLLRHADRHEPKYLPHYRLHEDLLSIRHHDPVLHALSKGTIDGAVLGEAAFLLRYFSKEHGDRLLLFNFGRRLCLDPAPEPLLCPLPEREWQLRWSSEEPRYGGGGVAPLSQEPWLLPPYCALLLYPSEERNGTN